MNITTETVPCPQCGYCPHCGRSAAPHPANPYLPPYWHQPAYPYWYYQPTYTTPVISCGPDGSISYNDPNIAFTAAVAK